MSRSMTTPSELIFAREILEEDFGSIVSQVGYTLLAYGNLDGFSIQDIQMYLHYIVAKSGSIKQRPLAHEDIKHALMILMQHNIVQVAASSGQQASSSSSSSAQNGGSGGATGSSSGSGATASSSASAVANGTGGNNVNAMNGRTASKDAKPQGSPPSGPKRASVREPAGEFRVRGDIDAVLWRPKFPEYLRMVSLSPIENATDIIDFLLKYGRMERTRLAQLLVEEASLSEVDANITIDALLEQEWICKVRAFRTSVVGAATRVVLGPNLRVLNHMLAKELVADHINTWLGDRCRKVFLALADASKLVIEAQEDRMVSVVKRVGISKKDIMETTGFTQEETNRCVDELLTGSKGMVVESSNDPFGGRKAAPKKKALGFSGAGTGARLYEINWTRTRVVMRRQVANQIVRWSFGPLAFRIFNALNEEPVLMHEERKLEDLCLVTGQKVRQQLNILFRNHLCFIQEIPKGQHSVATAPPLGGFGFGSSSNYGKGVWLYGIDMTRMHIQLLEMTIQKARNVKSRLRSEESEIAVKLLPQDEVEGEQKSTLMNSMTGNPLGEEQVNLKLKVDAEACSEAKDLLRSRFLSLQNMYCLLRDV